MNNYIRHERFGELATKQTEEVGCTTGTCNVEQDLVFAEEGDAGSKYYDNNFLGCDIKKLPTFEFIEGLVAESMREDIKTGKGDPEDHFMYGLLTELAKTPEKLVRFNTAFMPPRAKPREHPFDNNYFKTFEFKPGPTFEIDTRNSGFEDELEVYIELEEMLSPIPNLGHIQARGAKYADRILQGMEEELESQQFWEAVGRVVDIGVTVVSLAFGVGLLRAGASMAIKGAALVSVAFDASDITEGVTSFLPIDCGNTKGCNPGAIAAGYIGQVVGGKKGKEWGVVAYHSINFMTAFGGKWKAIAAPAMPTLHVIATQEPDKASTTQ